MEKRQLSERSLENLKLGALARRQGKARYNFSLLPETVVWLKGTGNASDAIDALVLTAKNGGLVSSNTHDKKDEKQMLSNGVYNPSDDTYNRIKELEDNQAKLEAKLEAREQEISQLRSQLEEVQAKSLTADLEATRDRFLASLKLGKQAAEYKRIKAVIDRFIAILQQWN